ncbi:MAG: hypothetical protein DRI56_08845, partial [Chloroflexota bacterium]
TKTEIQSFIGCWEIGRIGRLGNWEISIIGILVNWYTGKLVLLSPLLPLALTSPFTPPHPLKSR